jgi:hypothetical protein
VGFRFWQRWLQASFVTSALLGFLFLVAPGSGVLAGYNRQVVEAFHGAPVPAAALEQQRWAIAVLGSAMLGWSILLFWVATVPFGRREPWAWRSIALSVAAWAIGDSIVSHQAGISLEVLWNAIVVALVALPLAMTYRAVTGKGAGADRSPDATARRSIREESRQ